MLHKKTQTDKSFSFFFKYPLILLVFLCSYFSAQSQIDSLKAELKKAKSDTLRVNILNEISYYILFDDVKKAKKYVVDALELSTKINFERGIMRSYGQLGNVFNAQNKYDEAIESYLNGLRIAEKRNDLHAQSSFNHNIGLLYLKLEQNNKAAEFILTSIELDKKLGDKTSISVSYNSLGSLYFQQNDYERAQLYFNEALKYVNKEAPVIEDASVYTNLGVIYRHQRRYQSAKDYFKKGAEIYLKYESTVNAAKLYVNLAELEMAFKKYDEAILNFEYALKLMPDLHKETSINFDAKKIFIGLAESYMFKNDYKNAALSYQKLVQNFQLNVFAKDSLLLKEANKAFAEMATKYESEKKDAALRESKLETEKQKEANAKKNVILYSLTIGGILLVLMLIIVFRSYRISKSQTRKINIQKNQIEKQRDEIVHINKEITASIEYAKNIQNSILPDDFTLQKAFHDHFILWLPRDIVSGDFYWFHEENGYLFIATADCTGHGVPGAFVSVSCVNILNQVVIDERITDTSRILSRVHQHVCDIFRRKDSELKSNDGMDISICRIDKKKMEIQFSGAMNSLIKIRNGEVEEFKGDRSAIGGRTPYEYSFSGTNFNYGPEDSFYMYSDGFKDQFGGPNGKKYLNSRFLQYLLKINDFSMSEQKKSLDEELKNWCGNTARIDDVLVLGFKP